MFSKILKIITAPYNGVGITEEYINYHCSTLDISRDQLKTFTIPDSITEIGHRAFEGCSALTSVTLHDGVTKIGYCAFQNCTSLESIDIPDSVTSIDLRAFINCNSLKSITIPDSVTEIKARAFDSCKSLTSITLPDSVSEIRFNAFQNCNSLESITIPDSITVIRGGAFALCSSLTQIICNNPDLFTDQNIQNRDQKLFISTTDYFNDNYQELLNTIEDSGFNSSHVTSKELNLIMKLYQEDYLPNWNTIATTFNGRSMDQIRFILNHFNKTSCMPDTENSILLQQNEEPPITINGLSMFLNPTDHANLSMTANNVILRTKEKDSASFCSIQ